MNWVINNLIFFIVVFLIVYIFCYYIAGRIKVPKEKNKDKKSFTKTAYASDYDTYIKVVALAFAEGGGKSKDNCVENVSNVVSSVLNRVADGRFGGHDVISVISAKNQYAGYESKNYKEIINAFKDGNIGDYMSDDQLIAIYNLLDDEKRTTSCNSFRGDGKTNKFYNM